MYLFLPHFSISINISSIFFQFKMIFNLVIEPQNSIAITSLWVNLSVHIDYSVSVECPVQTTDLYLSPHIGSTSTSNISNAPSVCDTGGSST
jgi:hypothetical protein